MYSSGYSQVSKHSPQAKRTMQYRSNSKSCGYYMRIVFFFSSLIQSLIIVSLVLFLVYGKTQDSACKERIQDLEERFSQLSLENVALKKQRTNLTNFLNATLTEKARIDFDLRTLRHQTNISILYFHDYEMKLQQFNIDLMSCRLLRSSPCPTSQNLNTCNCGLLVEQLKAKFQLVNSNFTQSVQTMKMEMEEIAKERDNLNLETIKLRRDITTKEKQLQIYEKTSKDEFSQSLGSVYNVSRAFLHKIDLLFPAHIAFQLTCPKQREHLDQIRSNCTNLSREVEDKLQRYMNTVGNHVSGIQNENIRLKAENWRFSEDYRSCSQERAVMVEQHKQNLDKLQQKHDQDQERLLKEKKKLSGEKEVLENTVNYKTKQIESLMQQIQQLNKSRTGLGFTGVLGLQPATPVQNRWGSLGGVGSSSSSSSSTGFGQQGKTGSVGVLGPGSSSLGSSFNKPASTLLGATGASSSNSPLFTGSRVSSPGLGLNKPGSTLTGGAFPSLGSAESSPNLSSGGIGSTNPLLSGRGSSSIGSSSGSSVLTPNLSSNGFSLNKQTSSTRSSGFGLGSSSSSSSSSPSSSSSSSSSSSASSTNKNAFGFSWFGSSNSGQSKTPNVPGKGTSSGTSTGAGSPFGAGKPNGMTGNVGQHIQNLQRLINPPGPQEKQDLSRMLG